MRKIIGTLLSIPLFVVGILLRFIKACLSLFKGTRYRFTSQGIDRAIEIPARKVTRVKGGYLVQSWIESLTGDFTFIHRRSIERIQKVSPPLLRNLKLVVAPFTKRFRDLGSLIGTAHQKLYHEDTPYRAIKGGNSTLSYSQEREPYSKRPIPEPHSEIDQMASEYDFSMGGLFSGWSMDLRRESPYHDRENAQALQYNAKKSGLIGIYEDPFAIQPSLAFRLLKSLLIILITFVVFSICLYLITDDYDAALVGMMVAVKSFLVSIIISVERLLGL